MNIQGEIIRELIQERAEPEINISREVKTKKKEHKPRGNAHATT